MNYTFDYEKFMNSSNLKFDANFESGSIDRVVQLGLDWYQIVLRQDTWYLFYFRMTGCKGREIIFEFTCRNNKNPNYDEGNKRWLQDTGIVKPLYSYDKKNWDEVQFIEKHNHDIGKYRFIHKFINDEVYLCQNLPYSYSDLLSWLKKLEESGTSLKDKQIEIDSIGNTRNGLSEPVITIKRKQTSPKNLVVIIGREDADESTGSWGIEGLVRYLISENANSLYNDYVFKIIPMVSIDGIIAGSTYSAGYGYGGWCWHLNPGPLEIENVKTSIKNWVKQGYDLKFAGKLHGTQFMTKRLGPDDIKTPSIKVRKILRDGINEYYNNMWNPKASISQ